MKADIGKIIGRIFVTAIIAAIILAIVTGLINAIIAGEGPLQSFLKVLLGAAFFVGAVKVHPGKEDFLEVLPVVLVSAGLVELIGNWIKALPSLIIPFTWTGLALGLGSVFLAMTIAEHIVK